MSERRSSLRSTYSQRLDTETFQGREEFEGGLLPTERHVIEMMIWGLASRVGTLQVSVKEVAQLVAEILHDHWVWSNVYPKKLANISTQVENLYTEFKNLRQTRPERQTASWRTKRVMPFLERIKRGFDIGTNDVIYLAKMESLYGVKMEEEDRQYREDQVFDLDHPSSIHNSLQVNGKRKMYCEAFADKKWLAMVERRSKREEARVRAKERDKSDQVKLFTKAILDDDDDLDMTLEEAVEQKDDTFDIRDEENNDDKVNERRRTLNKEKKVKCIQDLPTDWQHIRHSIRKVREPYYRTVDVLISKYHTSYEQAVAAVVTVGRLMFGLEWERFEEAEEITLNTVPDKKMNKKMGKAFEASTLSEVVEEMMSEDTTTVTYHDDGSRSQGTGGYSVQGISIRGKFHPLPTLSISSETRNNLADLKLTILQLLSVTGGVSVEALWERIDFTMGDSTAHNLGVEEIVAEKLESEHVPGQLLCQVHPCMMFSRELEKVWKEIDTTIGPNKIFAHFNVSLSDQNDSVTQQWLNCLLRLVSHDFDHKSWNKACEFDLFLAPAVNPAKRLIKERFNSLVYSCAVALFLDAQV